MYFVEVALIDDKVLTNDDSNCNRFRVRSFFEKRS